MRPLSLLEARVLGVLVEKAHTVPDSYPLSLNSLTLGCNQKTAREPVIAASEGEVQEAVDALRTLSLVFESSGSRVTRFEHNVGRVLALPSQSVALLATLVLRGPQTASELRANSDRLHRFADLSSVEGFLEELATRADEKGGALCIKLARAAGAREQRWAHLLSGPLQPTVVTGAAEEGVFLATGEIAAVRARLTRAESDLEALRRLVDHVYRELDLPRPEDAA